MGKPKKRTSSRRTGSRRSHLVIKLARAVNAKSPVKAFTTRRESGKVLAATKKAAAPAPAPAKKAAKPSAQKQAAAKPKTSKKAA